MIIAPEFEENISRSDLELIKDCADIMCLVDSDLRLTGYNQAWVDFAEKNNGTAVLKQYSLGKKLFPVIDDPISSFLVQKYRAALEKYEPFEQNYECSSAEQFRVFHSTAYPLNNSIGLMISHHLIVEKEHTDTVVEFSEQFVNEHNFVAQCSNCRKIRDPQNPSAWYWVPDLVESPLPNISHTICPPCMVHYYPDLQ